LEIRALKIHQEKIGVTTAAEWVDSLLQSGSLVKRSPSLQQFLEHRAVDWWYDPDVPDFPSERATEAAECQGFVGSVIARINDLQSSSAFTFRKKKVQMFGTSAYTKTNSRMVLNSVPVDGHACVSFASRKPDIPCYVNNDQRGACSITMIGDVKGGGSRYVDFSKANVGHILDMAKDLMTKEQFTRAQLYCFLTDGYRFQFFRCSRVQRSEEINFEQTHVYGGVRGWQVVSFVSNPNAFSHSQIYFYALFENRFS